MMVDRAASDASRVVVEPLRAVLEPHWKDPSFPLSEVLAVEAFATGALVIRRILLGATLHVGSLASFFFFFCSLRRKRSSWILCVGRAWHTAGLACCLCTAVVWRWWLQLQLQLSLHGAHPLHRSATGWGSATYRQLYLGTGCTPRTPGTTYSFCGSRFVVRIVWLSPSGSFSVVHWYSVIFPSAMAALLCSRKAI